MLTFTATMAGGLAIMLAAGALALLYRLTLATERIGEIMRRSHAADLDRYSQRILGEDPIAETPLDPSMRFKTMDQ